MRIPREETSLRQRATQALRSAIFDGVFAPGQKLSERELCELLDVSRTCVRESLQHLQAEGLITIVPHRGPEVAVISAEEVRDIYAVRASLEELAVRGFVAVASVAQKAALRRVSMAHPGRLAEATTELDALVSAIELGDEDQAAQLCCIHIRNSAANALRNMQEAESRKQA